MPELLSVAFGLWSAGLLLALLRLSTAARWLIGLGAAAGVAGAVSSLPYGGTVLTLPIALADQAVRLHYTPEALWLMGFGLVPAALAVWLCSPVRSGRPGWLAGAALSLLGALGVYGVQDGYSFLISWELMSLGGAVMILSERLSVSAGRSTLFMLALLEVGAVAIMLALLVAWNRHGGSLLDRTGNGQITAPITGVTTGSGTGAWTSPASSLAHRPCREACAYLSAYCS